MAGSAHLKTFQVDMLCRFHYVCSLCESCAGKLISSYSNFCIIITRTNFSPLGFVSTPREPPPPPQKPTQGSRRPGEVALAAISICRVGCITTQTERHEYLAGGVLYDNFNVF
jgi:hypothetical protein